MNPHQSFARCDVWPKGMKNESHSLLLPASVQSPPTHTHPLFVSPPSLCRRSSAAHPRAVRPKSGQQMRNKWVLSGTHEGGRYAYQGFSGGLYPTCHSCDLSPRPSSSFSLPALLSEECVNAARRRMEGRRKWDKGERTESLVADRPTLHADTFS